MYKKQYFSFSQYTNSISGPSACTVICCQVILRFLQGLNPEQEESMRKTFEEGALLYQRLSIAKDEHTSFEFVYKNSKELRESLEQLDCYHCTLEIKLGNGIANLAEVIREIAKIDPPVGAIITCMSITVSILFGGSKFIFFDSHTGDGIGAYYIMFNNVQDLAHYLVKDRFKVDENVRQAFANAGTLGDVEVDVTTVRLRAPRPSLQTSIDLEAEVDQFLTKVYQKEKDIVEAQLKEAKKANDGLRQLADHLKAEVAAGNSTITMLENKKSSLQRSLQTDSNANKMFLDQLAKDFARIKQQYENTVKQYKVSVHANALKAKAKKEEADNKRMELLNEKTKLENQLKDIKKGD